MSKRSALAVAVTVGLSLVGCGDDKAGPGVGPDTSWQFVCVPGNPTGMCNTTDSKPHGPLDGRDAEDKSDDYQLKVSCSRPASGLTITLTDPGRARDVSKGIEPRPQSVLEISRAKPDNNECQVALTEYTTSAKLVLKDSCGGNSGNPGGCTLTGEFDSANGYAFEGTLQCDELKYNGNPPAAWMLRAATPNTSQPVTLQIANCD